MKSAAKLIFSLAVTAALGFAAGHFSYVPTMRLLGWVEMVTGLSKLDRELNAMLLGRPVPAVPLRSTEGRAADLASMVPPPALVVFSSVSCPYCRTLRGILDSKRAAGELGPLHLVLINVDNQAEVGTSGNSKTGSEGWLQGSLPRDDENLTICLKYGLFPVPAIWFVDSKGKVVSRMNGFTEYTLDSHIKRLLQATGKPSASVVAPHD